MKNIEKRNFIWNIVGSTVNAFTSLIFAIVVTRINGIDTAGIFTFSFATACLLYVVGNYFGRTFQVTDISKKYSDTDYIFNRITTCFFMILTTIIFILIKRYDLYKASILIILCIYKSLEAFFEALYGVLQRNNQLYKVGISMFFKAIISVILFFIIDFFTKNLIISCISIVGVNIIVSLLYDFKNIKKLNIQKSNFTSKTNFFLLKSGFFTFCLNFLTLYLINASRYAIDDISTNEIQTIFGIIIMPATFMLIAVQYVLQPFLVKVSKYIEEKNYINLKNIIIKLIQYTTVLGIGVFIVSIIFEKPVLEFVYGIDLDSYYFSIIIIILGSIFYAISCILSNILIALRQIVIQVCIYGIIAILTTLLSYFMILKYNIFGASITYLITMFISMILFINVTFRKINICN